MKLITDLQIEDDWKIYKGQISKLINFDSLFFIEKYIRINNITDAEIISNPTLFISNFME